MFSFLRLRPISLSSYCLCILMAAYLMTFGLLLFFSDGMPYILDGNETYSSITHAKSISNFGILKSYGLADEVFSPSSMAHPFVHSHQGNYPRLFAWVIYELGARGPKEQILITTFTVGLAAILLAFVFLSRISNNLFALIACLTLVTDYIFFSQWQVVTYRVWYTFVFFLQFFAIEQYLKKKNVRWALLVLTNTAMFCYGELIFAAFLGLLSFFWLVLRSWRDRKRLFFGVLWLITGLFLAIFTLVAQGIGYLGADHFLRDIQLTFLARNNFDNGGVPISEISKFYKSQNVVFWENIVSRDQFIGFKPFIRSIFSSFMLIYSPLASIFIGMLFLNNVVSPALLKIYENAANKLTIIQGHSSTLIVVVQYFFSGLTIFSFMKVSAGIAHYYYGLLLDPWLLPMLATEIVACSWIIISLGGYAIFHFNFMLLSTAAISSFLPYFIDNAYSPYWVDMHGIQITHGLLVLPPLFSIVSAFSSTSVRVSRNVRCRSAEIFPPLPQVFKFLFLGLLAYIIVYFLSPGYVFSGYIGRYAPFFVFVFDLGIAIAFYQLAYFAYASLLINSSSIYKALKITSIYLAIALFFLMILLWLGLQYSLVYKLPPTHFSVLERLSAYPYKDASFVVNTYAAPVAVQTGQWAYMDPNIGRALFKEVKGENRLLGDQRYLWFADKNSNDEYRKPTYFICLLGQDASTILRQIIDKKNYKGCLDFPLVRLALHGQYSNRELRLIDYDKMGERNTGAASWAIIEFDWNGSLGGGLYWEGDPTVPAVNSK